MCRLEVPEIQNAGRTPAYNDAIQAFITVADYPLIKNFERVTCPRTILQPDKRKMVHGQGSRERKRSARRHSRWKRSRPFRRPSRLYYHGTVCYRDIFHESQPHRLLYVWKWDAGRLESFAVL